MTAAVATPPPADASTRATPPPSDPPAAPLPPEDSVVVTTTGDYEYLDLVHSWVESTLSGGRLQVIDGNVGGNLADLAQYQVSVTAALVGSRALQFAGRSELQYTVALTMRATDLTTGALVTSPATATVEYTAINLQEQLERGTRALTRRLTVAVRRELDGRPARGRRSGFRPGGR